MLHSPQRPLTHPKEIPHPLPQTQTYASRPLLPWSPSPVRKKNPNWFNNITTKINNRMTARTTSDTSTAGRNCLIKFVTNSMANYIMSSTLLPKISLAQINQSHDNFWWGKLTNKYCNPWNQICKPLHCGGLGTSDMHTTNLVLLRKLAFQVLSTSTCLLSRVLVAEYEKFVRLVLTSSHENLQPNLPWTPQPR